MTRTVKSALDAAQQRLEAVSETAALDAQVLLAHLLNRGRAWVLAHPEAPLSAEQAKSLEQMLKRLQSGEPLPYVLGHWEFYGLDFSLTPDVLIPRPETELLVERAVQWLKVHPFRRLAADVGTGSGCIAVALAVNFPDLYIVAGDRSFGALKVAQANAYKHGVAGRIDCIQLDLLPETGKPFDLVCANLPYIPRSELNNLPVVKREPVMALDGGEEGLELIRRLLKRAPHLLAPGGYLLLEIEASHGEAVLVMAQQAFPEGKVELLIDLAGRDRLVTVESPSDR
jgi:release factor glutamine methyltransferase